MYKKSNKDDFFRSTGFKRLVYLDWFSLAVSVVGIIASIAAIILSFTDAWPQLLLFIKSIFGISIAQAAETIAGNPDPSPDYKPLINLGIMLSIGIAFFWSLAITFHSNEEDKVKTAGDINKMLLGFLIGSGKSFLGLG